MKFGKEYKLFHTSFYSGCHNLYMRRSSLTILVKHEKISEVIYAIDIDAAINAISLASLTKKALPRDIIRNLTNDWMYNNRDISMWT